MKSVITALPKGRLMGEVIDILKQSGFISNNIDINTLSRQLVFHDKKTRNSFLLAKPKDVPVYVEHGAADLGITGKDVLLEHGRNLYEMVDLGVGKCKLVVAVPESKGYKSLADIPEYSRVATSYPEIVKKFFQGKGIQVEVIKLNGSVELAPLVDLADVIVDISSTGTTLKKNNLIPMETIVTSSARLVVNNVSYKIKHKQISELINKINEVVKSGNTEISRK
ncbi:ATP phosphoribosyltransferase [Halothermothrix orenii]|uniref:ATP phosphoribosyltransferase n=1 Tax=Halothermothrix orenii (strain H 168 / OCM 544 / DSM 9562) TaxID=373903 RepID=HIS1_HALOH|nr:ATP phosphoribosyltransferase [Halothermothrix orenii]B8D111.1 RecName: Full=ATP phosphoribosyltransferase; Short=ATP-PRT; Short=ATP-PRTase [Halothermothrix orenii H 168]ACL68980.1 ATP phosphoribosyltransferase [Halothermothrix orenii H 168]